MRRLLCLAVLVGALAACHEPEQPPPVPPKPTDPTNVKPEMSLARAGPAGEVLDASIVADTSPSLDAASFLETTPVRAAR
jgi:hypothetical protein